MEKYCALISLTLNLWWGSVDSFSVFFSVSSQSWACLTKHLLYSPHGARREKFRYIFFLDQKEEDVLHMFFLQPLKAVGFRVTFCPLIWNGNSLFPPRSVVSLMTTELWRVELQATTGQKERAAFKGRLLRAVIKVWHELRQKLLWLNKRSDPRHRWTQVPINQHLSTPHPPADP